MTNPTIVITGIGRHWFNYTITMPDGSEKKGSARNSEKIVIPIYQEESNDEQ